MDKSKQKIAAIQEGIKEELDELVLALEFHMNRIRRFADEVIKEVIKDEA